jgi:hypothetical protein
MSEFPEIQKISNNIENEQVAELVRSVCFADYFYCLSALELAAKHPVGFLAIYFQGADVLSRLEERADNVRPEMLAPVVNEYYRYLDYLLGRLVNAYRPLGLLTVVCDPGKKGRRIGNRGMVVFHGLDVGRGEGQSGVAELEDIAPTVLYLTGLPVSSNMSGRALVEAGAKEPGGARPLRFVTTYGPPSPRPAQPDP